MKDIPEQIENPEVGYCYLEVKAVDTSRIKDLFPLKTAFKEIVLAVSDFDVLDDEVTTDPLKRPATNFNVNDTFQSKLTDISLALVQNKRVGRLTPELPVLQSVYEVNTDQIKNFEENKKKGTQGRKYFTFEVEEDFKEYCNALKYLADNAQLDNSVLNLATFKYLSSAIFKSGLLL